MTHPPVQLVQLGKQDYQTIWRQMQKFTDQRTSTTPDQVWLVEHPPVFTVGLNGGMEHVLAPGDIPVIQIDRGGQVTYHGPGQLLIYPLLNLRRNKMGIRDLVTGLENTVIRTLAHNGIQGLARRDAPGVYVEGNKIASLGLRIRRGCSYHGLAFNVAMDLEPFQRINPCGFSDLEVTDLQSLGVTKTLEQVSQDVLPHLTECLSLRIS